MQDTSYGERKSEWRSLISQSSACVTQHTVLTALCFYNAFWVKSPFCFPVQFSNQRHPRGYTWSKESTGRAAARRREIYVCGDLAQDFWGKVVARMGLNLTLKSLHTLVLTQPYSCTFPLWTSLIILWGGHVFCTFSSNHLEYRLITRIFVYIIYIWHVSTYPQDSHALENLPLLEGEVTVLDLPCTLFVFISRVELAVLWFVCFLFVLLTLFHIRIEAGIVTCVYINLFPL